MNAPVFVSREIKGQQIAKNLGWVRRTDEHSYMVHSQSRDFEYSVLSTEFGWVCSCPDSMLRGSKCKHVHAVELSFILRKVVAKEQVIIQAISVKNCPKCNSENIVKHGVRKNKAQSIQRWSCKVCGKWFVINLGFERMHATPQAISGAMQLYFTGESLRNVQKFLLLQGVNISHVSVYKWIRKYVNLMNEYLSKITPQVGDKWRADEMYLKVKGNPKWLFAMIDDETRFWIAKQVAEKKWYSNVSPMYREAKAVAGKTPNVLITDGARNFHTAFKKEFYSRFGVHRRHIQDVTFHRRPHNNKMERFNGELRDREKVMRSFKNEDSPILKGMQIHHNFIRAHEGLDGKTPAEAAGIKVEGENKWITIIQNASYAPRVNKENEEPLS